MGINKDHKYLKRCYDLARRGAGRVSPNPLVGAVIVHNDRIIGEGYHQQYGQAHAEVNAVASVQEEDRHLLPSSTIYVSLEPCNIHGRTPPCTDLILRNKFNRVVIGQLDQTPEVSGNSVILLNEKNVQVDQYLSGLGYTSSVIRNHYAATGKPYVILKYAVSKNGFIGTGTSDQAWLSNPLTKRFAHKLRNDHDAILIGVNTGVLDNPQLTNRFYRDKQPIKVVIDPQLRLSPNAKLLESGKTIIFHGAESAPSSTESIEYCRGDFNLPVANLLQNLLLELGNRKITSILIEGGQKTLQNFIDHNAWQQAVILRSNSDLDYGVHAPVLNVPPSARKYLGNNQLELIQNPTDIFANALNLV